MSGAPPLPPTLRRAIADDRGPVRPLASPVRRALALLAWAAIAVPVLLALRGLRPDLDALGFLCGWGVVVAEVAAGTALVALALAEAVPGRGAGRGTALVALAAALGLFGGLALLARRESPGMAVGDALRDHGLGCFSLQGLVGVTALAVAAVLVLRAAPLRASLSGLLAGAGAGLMAEGVYHLDCPITDLTHVLVWHGSAILLLALLGLGLGLAVERRERARMEARRAAVRRDGADR